SFVKRSTMMKKLLVLTLVMGIASLATAALSFDIGGTIYEDGATVLISGQTTVGLYNDTQFTGVPDIGWINVAPGTEVVGSGTVDSVGTGGTILPGTWTIDDFGLSYGVYWWQTVNTVPGVGDTLVGNMFTVDVVGDTLLQVFQSDFVTPVASVNLVTPEPMTMALLGLGGLLIRRKK
ncbi:MAG: PEP-CTERM sorting domain-containing protein, partial [Planctomycetota bacterium]